MHVLQASVMKNEAMRQVARSSSLLSLKRETTRIMFLLAATAKLAMGIAMVTSPAASHQAPTHVVHSGESLWSISAPQGHDYMHLFALNQDKIKDPDMIYPGQKLRMSGKVTESPATTSSVVTPAVPKAANVSGNIWNVTYGYPNKCGDGDGDGWDVACSKLFPATTPAVVRKSTVTSFASTASNSAVSLHSGTYSYSGLEALWTSAGGPSWAAPHAASIAECESGGRTNAYNPSGATGLWQILGSVVPGNLYDAYTNALNAVSKFKASGDTFAQWVCQ